ncbi:MAG: hypothetical protein J1E43_12070 [Christensenellaceae bacterium]|nr:hypothetical protein [Christensenellaceae bacterium]
MDGLFSLIWVIFIVVTLVNAASGKNKKKQTEKQNPVPPLTAKPITEPAKPADFSEIQKRFAEMTKTKTEQTRMPPKTKRPAQPATVAAPRVHTHLAPDCDRDDPTGSMDFISTEGIDPCHDGDLPSRSEPRPSFPVVREQPGLALDWTSDALVKSVIMQEVLTRPCQRRRR